MEILDANLVKMYKNLKLKKLQLALLFFNKFGTIWERK